MCIFWKKLKIIPLALNGPRPLPTITTLSGSFLALNAISTIEEEQNNYSKLLLSHTFPPIFHFQLSSFSWQGCKNISCPWAQGTLATPLLVSTSIFSKFTTDLF